MNLLERNIKCINKYLHLNVYYLTFFSHKNIMHIIFYLQFLFYNFLIFYLHLNIFFNHYNYITNLEIIKNKFVEKL